MILFFRLTTLNEDIGEIKPHVLSLFRRNITALIGHLMMPAVLLKAACIL